MGLGGTTWQSSDDGMGRKHRLIGAHGRGLALPVALQRHVQVDVKHLEDIEDPYGDSAGADGSREGKTGAKR